MIGALVALLAPFPPKPEPEQPSLDSEIERLTRENWRIARSHARLVDHIESLEREILTERHICKHWKEEAERLARQSREERERRQTHQSQTQWQGALACADAPRAGAVGGLPRRAGAVLRAGEPVRPAAARLP